MFERPQSGERAALIQVDVGRDSLASAREEFHLLAHSAGAICVWEHTFFRDTPEPRYFIGKGQAELIAEAVRANDIQLVIFNAPLSPSQERNLEQLFSARVLDRSGLVLDIFAQRARSHEGKLQVELAQLRYLSTRLVRGWTHLERQKGGIGLRGPGETQLETDKRLLSERIKQLKKRLDKVRRNRYENRKSRARNSVPTVALAGYTNSGKSTLFNALTDASVLAKNQLFATLDTTWRKLSHHGDDLILLADTVGFVSDLPHELVAAFQSTLEETAFADLILHVIDYSDSERLEREAVVEKVLSEIGAQDVPCLRVFNKIDLKGESARVLCDEYGHAHSVFISARTGEGLDLLKEAIVAHFLGHLHQGWLMLSQEEGALRAELFKLHAVQEERYDDEGRMFFFVRLLQRDYQRLQSKYNRQLVLQKNEDYFLKSREDV